MQQINGITVIHVYVLPLVPSYIEIDIDEYSRIIVYHIPKLEYVAMQYFDITKNPYC